MPFAVEKAWRAEKLPIWIKEKFRKRGLFNKKSGPIANRTKSCSIQDVYETRT